MNFLLLRKFSNPSKEYSNALENIGLFPVSQEKYFSWEKEWNHAFSLWNAGKYQQSVTRRKEILSEVYFENQCDSDGYFPPTLSQSYFGPIGHIGVLGVHWAAQSLNLIPNGKRFIALDKVARSKPFFSQSTFDYQIIPYASQTGWTDLPSQWHFAERLQMVRTSNDFLDFHQLIERVFTTSRSMNQPLLRLHPDYLSKCSEYLRTLGLQEGEWFATIHVRDTGDPNDIRHQSIASYFEAIRFILDQGGKVIRIGNSTMEKIPKMDGLIDLSINHQVNEKYHLYALAMAQFFIGTNSGPKMIPPLFGVPTLITNLTAIGIENFYLSDKSIYLPKVLSYKGNSLSYYELTHCSLGFDNRHVDQLKKLGITIRNNTAEEIFLATKELFESLSSKNNERQELDDLLYRIRSDVFFASSGSFSSTWLQRNSWFLDQTIYFEEYIDE